MPKYYKSKNFRNYLFLFLSAVPLLIHLYINFFAGYGYFRDELYYIACSNRPAAGYVDQPPLSIFILILSRNLFGDSLFALRSIPAVLSGLTVFITCLMVKETGGKTFATILASLAVILSPVYLAMNSYYSMNSLDIFLWSLAFYLVMLIINKNKTVHWIILGIVLGLGLLNKTGFLWFCAGLFAGLLLTDKRKELLTFKPYLTALIALAIFSPYLIWNFQNDFAHIEFIRNAVMIKYSGISYTDFITGQLINQGPVSVFIWLTGLYYFLFYETGLKFRIVAVIYVSVFLILLVNGHSKAEYLSPAYTVLFAGGSVLIERKTIVRSNWVRYALVIPLCLSGLLIAPFAAPVLPVETFIIYSNTLGIRPSSSENKEMSELPQFFADMHGWEEMASDVSKVYMSLPREERLRTVIYGHNYGEASAMEFFRNKYPIPRAISSHNSFWLWGYGNTDDPVMIIIGGRKEDHLEVFEEVSEKLIHKADYSMPYENNIPVYVAKKIKIPVNELWQRIKNYN